MISARNKFQITVATLFCFLLLKPAIAQFAPDTNKVQDDTKSQPRWVSKGGNIRIEPAQTRVGIGTLRTPLGVLHINGEFDAELKTGPTGTIHLQNGVNSLLLDSNEIMARKVQSGTPELPKKIIGSQLHLNADGGGVVINGKLAKSQQVAITTSGRIVLGGGNKKHKSARLTASGTIVAQDLIVTPNDWADDVFREDYQLMGLEELAVYIDENRHLPGIAKETDVTSKGLKIGDFSKNVLRNLEELTLRLIDQNRYFKSKNADLERRVETLEKLRKLCKTP